MSDLEVELDAPSYAPGQPVSGTVRVLASGRCRRLEVELRYCERSPDYTEVARREGTVAIAEGPLEAGRSHRFTLLLPTDALPGLRSAHGALWWEVYARADRLGRDARASCTVSVASPGASS